MHLVGARLYLRPLNFPDAPRLVALVNASASELREQAPWMKDGKITRKEQEDYLLRAVQEMNLNQALHFGIALKELDDLVGVIATHPIDWLNESATIGYWVATEFSGKGFATEATILMLEGLFMELKLRRVAVTAATDNVASNRVIEKIGFRFEGVLRQAGKVAPSRWKDLNAYALLDEEYKATRKSLFEKFLAGSYPKVKLT
ncbi:MAG: GNAT family N-acetyltransferase [Chloroherpetonaceae bacterium]|nr:GNAT family N-acetyltransferase [Chloroherpetonaceae bacterium]MDW8438398.1 GNAT family protein [Chloroherpetonaceae bacterium]